MMGEGIDDLKVPRRAWLASARTPLRSACLCLVAGIALTACATPPLFYWGQYEDSLYRRYVKEDVGQGEVYLHNTITGAAQSGSRVPPGVYADYGFLLYRRGDYAGAIEHFEKEKQAYPESAALMSRIIERIQQQQSTDKQP